MSGELTRTELDKAVKSLKTTSAPGPDGIPSALLVRTWDKIATPQMKSFNHHLRANCLPKDYLTARLKLLPKKGDKHVLKN